MSLGPTKLDELERDIEELEKERERFETAREINGEALKMVNNALQRLEEIKADDERYKEIDRKVERLTEKEKRLKAAAEETLAEKEDLGRRLDEQAEDTRKRFGFIWEKASARDDISKQYFELFQLAWQVMEHMKMIIYTRDCRASSLSENALKVELLCHLKGVFKGVVNGAGKRYKDMQDSVEQLAKKSLSTGKNDRQDIWKPELEIFTDIVQLVAETSQPSDGRASSKAPLNFQWSTLMKEASADVQKAVREHYKSLKGALQGRQTDESQQEWSDFEKQYLHNFLVQCSEFAWNWLLLRCHGTLKDEMKASAKEHYQVVCEGEKTTLIPGEGMALVWPILLDNRNDIIHPGLLSNSDCPSPVTKASAV